MRWQVTPAATATKMCIRDRHGGIQIGFLNNDPAIFSMDEETGKLNGMLAEYISYAKDCLGNQRLKFGIQEYDDYNEMLRALQDHEIDMIFYVGRNPDLAEKKGYTLTNTAWTYSLMAVTDEKYFNENEAYSVAVVKAVSYTHLDVYKRQDESNEGTEYHAFRGCTEPDHQ